VVVRDLEDSGEYTQGMLYLDSLHQLVSKKSKTEIFKILRFTGDAARMKMIEPKVPMQENDYDWGLFVLQFIESIIEDPDILITGVKSEDLSISLQTTKLTRNKIKEIIKRGIE